MRRADAFGGGSATSVDGCTSKAARLCNCVCVGVEERDNQSQSSPQQKSLVFTRRISATRATITCNDDPLAASMRLCSNSRPNYGIEIV